MISVRLLFRSSFEVRNNFTRFQRYRPLSSYSFSLSSTALPPPSPPLLVIFCHIFIALLLLSLPFHPPGPFFLPHRFTLSTDSAIRQIARTNDEPPGDPFRTLYGFSIPGSARSSVSRDLSYFKVFHVRDLFGTKRSCDPCSCGSRVCKYLRRSFVFFLFHPGITGYKVIRDTWVLRPRLYKLDSSEANFSKYLINCKWNLVCSLNLFIWNLNPCSVRNSMKKYPVKWIF